MITKDCSTTLEVLMKTKVMFEEQQRIAHIGSWEWDYPKSEMSWSDEMFRILGEKPQIFMPNIDISLRYISEKDRESIFQTIKTALKKNGQFSLEHEVMRSDGSLCMVESQGHIIFENSTPVRLIGTMMDITEQKSAEKESHKLYCLFKRIIDNAPIGILWKDTELTYQGCNKVMAELIGALPEDTIDKTGYDLYSKENAESFSEDDNYVIRTGLPKLNYIEKFSSISGKDHILKTSKIPLFNDDGGTYGVLAVVQDVTEQKMAEEELLRAKENLEQAQQIAHIGSWEWDITNKRIFWSEEMYRIYGLDPKEFVPTLESVLSFIHPFEKDSFEESVKKSIREKNEFQNERRIIKQNGNVAYVLTRGKCFYDFEGNPISVIGTSLDITESKKADEEFKKYAEFEHTILSLANDFINVPSDKLDNAITTAIGIVAEYCKADSATVYIFNWNKKTADLKYKWNKKDYVTEDKWDSISLDKVPATCLELHMKGEIHVFNDCTESFKGIEDITTQSLLSVPLMREDNLFGVFSLCSTDLIKEWPKNFIASCKIFGEMLTNVLRRMDSEMKLQISNDKMRFILDSIKDGILMFDRDGNILDINISFAERFKINKEELLGKNVREAIPSKYQDLYDQRFEKMNEAFNTGKPIVFEDSANGSCFYNRFYPVFEDGKVSGVTLFSTDITDNRKAEVEAKSRNEYKLRLKLQTEFFTNVTHELKTPLSVILVQLELMRIYFDDKKKLNQYIAAATQNSYRLTRLIGNLLDISKLDAGFLHANYANSDIVPLLKEICEAVEAYAKAKSIQLRFRTLLLGKVMPLDTEKVERIMLNLLSNAIKHTEKNGKITVDLKAKKDGGVNISVKDTGEGIPQDKQKIIFDRFAQVDTSLTRKNEGCGIGLSLVKSLVEMLGGSIRVESTVGKGSNFTIDLPMHQIEPQTHLIEIEGYDIRKMTAMELSDLYLEE
jgi:PAS domain S-box-containing protein